MQRMPRLLSALSALTILTALAACGGDDDAIEDQGTLSIDDGTGSGEDGTGSGEDGTGGPVGATVTIGDQTFTASQELVCVRLGGAVGAQFYDEANDVTIDIDLPPEGWESDTTSDWDPPGVRVDDGDVDQWVAGSQEVEFTETPLVSSVSSYTIDGTHISGEAVFVETFGQMGGDITTVPGTFDATCAP